MRASRTVEDGGRERLWSECEPKACLIRPNAFHSRRTKPPSARNYNVARTWAPRDAAVQYCLEYLGFEHPDFELEGSARSVVQFEGIFPEAAPCVAYAPIDLNGHVSIVVDVPPEI